MQCYVTSYRERNTSILNQLSLFISESILKMTPRKYLYCVIQFPNDSQKDMHMVIALNSSTNYQNYKSTYVRTASLQFLSFLV